MKAAILTYHSQNITGNNVANNDHNALAADLNELHCRDYRFISLRSLINSIVDDAANETAFEDKRPMICLTFDDGCDFDVHSLEFGDFGLQPGFLKILEDFVRQYGKTAQPGLQATSFVIASPHARRVIDQHSLFGQGHMSDDWWKTAANHPLLDIANHGWDHNHPDLPGGQYPRGGFKAIRTVEHCRQQVVRAGEFICSKIGQWPQVFAYPFGESSDFIRNEFFPRHGKEHRCLAALGTAPGMTSSQSDRWNLPRYVCGRDWSSTAGLLKLLKSH